MIPILKVELLDPLYTCAWDMPKLLRLSPFPSPLPLLPRNIDPKETLQPLDCCCPIFSEEGGNQLRSSTDSDTAGVDVVADGPDIMGNVTCSKGMLGIGSDIGEVKLNKDILSSIELAVIIGVLTGISREVSSWL